MTSANATKTRLILVFSSLIYFFSLPSTAQDDDFDPLELLYGDEETVSIATGSSKPLHLAPSVASVITADDIRAMGALSIDDVLESVPGMHVSLGSRYSSLYSIRGIHSQNNPQVLMLINGVPITDVYDGSRLPTLRIPVNNIKQIEVIRGPGSAVYGADAFSGVINIITFDASELDETKINLSAGSFDTYGGSFLAGTTWNQWNVGLSLEWLQSDGDDGRLIESDLQAFIDSQIFTNVSLAPGSANTHYDTLNTQIQLSNKNWKFNLNSWEQSDAGIGVGVADALDTIGNQDASQHLFDMRYANRELSNDWEMEVNTSYLYSKQRSYYRIFPPGAVLPIGTDGNLNFVAPAGLVSFPEGFIGSPGGTENTLSTEIVLLNKGFDQHRLRFATGYKRQDMEPVETKNFGPGVIDGTQPVVDGTLTNVSNTPFVFMADQDRDVYYVSIQDEWLFVKDWEMTIGVRFDDYSDFGSTVNPRLAMVWQTSYNLTSKFLYGRAFRAPSFSELFAINNPVQIGNADLEPEVIDTYEFSFDYRPSYNLQTQLNLFYYQVDGLIAFVPDLSGGSIAQNFLDQEGHGVELEMQWKATDKINLSGSYSWQQSEDADSGQEIADAAQSLLSIDFRWQLATKWFFSTQWQLVSDRPRSVGDPRSEIEDYNIVNVNFYSKQLTSQWDLGLSIRNLFEEEAFEPGSISVPGDHPLQGRTVLLKADYRL